MTEAIYSAENIVGTIRANDVDQHNMAEVQRKLNFDYVHMSPSQFNNLVTQVERNNSHPATQQDWDRARTTANERGTQVQNPDYAQALGDVAVIRDNSGHVTGIKVNDSHRWTGRFFGGQAAGTEVFDKDILPPTFEPQPQAANFYDRGPVDQRSGFDQRAAQLQPRNFVPSATNVEPLQLNELERRSRQDLVDQSVAIVKKGETWNAVAHRLDPSLSYDDAKAFGTYLKHINGNRRYPLIDERIATRSAEEIDSMVRDKMARLMYGTQKYKY
jgi:hypothetical protein